MLPFLCSSLASLMRWHSPPDSVLERLAERQVVEADVAHRLELAHDLALGERLERLGDGQRRGRR